MALGGLEEIDFQIQHNRTIYRCYQKLLLALPGLKLLQFNEAEPTSFKNIVVELTDQWPLSRALTIELLNAEGILSRAYYYPPLHQKKMAYPAITTPLPFSERASQRYLLMPCGYQVGTEDVGRTLEFMQWLAQNHTAISAQWEKS
ncbi:MAG: DegT/DnrJ/EryC1/StrS family aminotransferase, partial [Limnobacter sp.]|nr:DegT/DnrJ/EryC1/StrS family aminotransferase [Limnobacter sp.]